MDANRTQVMEQTLDVESLPVTRVLVIDDDQDVGAAIQMILSRRGCDTVFAPDAHTGIHAFEASKFDIAMVDIFIPKANGLEIIARFRQQAPDVPIVAMSGFRFRDSMHADLDFLAMAAKRGATYCLRKPFGAEQLMGAINSGRGRAVSSDRFGGGQSSSQGARQ
jgi:DNA-binding NtrC family response regulator